MGRIGIFRVGVKLSVQHHGLRRWISQIKSFHGSQQIAIHDSLFCLLANHFSIGKMTGGHPQMDKYRASTEKAHLEQLSELAAGTRCRFMLLGDSYFERFRWNPELQAYLELLKKLGVFILAKGGDKIEHLSWRLSHQTLDPAIFPFTDLEGIGLLIGLNNLADKPAKRLTIPDKICQILDRLNSRFNVPIYLFTLPHTPQSRDEGWDIDTINQMIIQQCHNRSPPVFIVDPWGPINKDLMDNFKSEALEVGAGTDYFEDQAHLNQKGYHYLIQVITKMAQ